MCEVELIATVFTEFGVCHVSVYVCVYTMWCVNHISCVLSYAQATLETQ